MSTEKQQQPVAFYPALLGKVLGALRKDSKLDQSQVAARVGLSQSAWSRIEKGATAITVSQLAATAQAFGRRPSDILRYTDDIADRLRKQGVRVENAAADDRAELVVALGAAAIAAIVIAAIHADSSA
jgi:transcriptional regulator with XRE-family HTH domain